MLESPGHGRGSGLLLAGGEEGVRDDLGAFGWKWLLGAMVGLVIPFAKHVNDGTPWRPQDSKWIIAGAALPFLLGLRVNQVRLPATLHADLEEENRKLKDQIEDPPLTPVEQVVMDQIAAACDGCSDQCLRLLATLAQSSLPLYGLSDEGAKEFEPIRWKLSGMILAVGTHLAATSEVRPFLRRYVNARLTAAPQSSKRDS